MKNKTLVAVRGGDVFEFPSKKKAQAFIRDAKKKFVGAEFAISTRRRP
jgi:hypothetical protein